MTFGSLAYATVNYLYAAPCKHFFVGLFVLAQTFLTIKEIISHPLKTLTELEATWKPGSS